MLGSATKYVTVCTKMCQAVSTMTRVVMNNALVDVVVVGIFEG